MMRGKYFAEILKNLDRYRSENFKLSKQCQIM